MRPSNLFHIGKAQNNHLTINPERDGALIPSLPLPLLSLSLSIRAPFYGYSKLPKATGKGKKLKLRFVVTPKQEDESFHQ